MSALLSPLRRAALTVCGLMVLIQPVAAENLVTDLSSHVIKITSRFSGTELLIFGAIERYIPQADGGHGVVIEGTDYDVVVVVQSEPRDMVIRRKEQAGPIWANRESRILQNVHGFHAMTSTRPLDVILSKADQRMLKADLDHLDITFREPMPPGEEKAFRDGFVRNMKARNLYNQQEGMVSVLDDILFRAILDFPANMPVGDYHVEVHLVRGGEIILSRRSPLEVEKAGLERLIYSFAHNYPALYGLMAVLIALFTGWLGGFLSRKMN